MKHESSEERKFCVALYEEIKRLRQELSETRGEHIKNEMDAFQRTAEIFRANNSELRATLEKHETVDTISRVLLERSHENEKLHYQIQHDVSLALHNFLTASSTLIDHNRNMLRRLYRDTDFRQEVERKRVEFFEESSIVQLVGGLRNYITHYNLPVTVSQLNFQSADYGGDGKLHAVIVLEAASLKEYKKWKACARNYMKLKGKHISIAQIRCEYEAAIQPYYDWFSKRQSEVDNKAFGERNELASRLHSLEVQLAKIEKAFVNER